MMPPSMFPNVSTLSLWSGFILLRALVGLQPHSGQNNYHGSHTAYGGDFEAQRHWMELTIHLPPSQWYWHDLDYWGLDYPPLTAYVSYVCGKFSEWLVGPESVALYDSRGIEDPSHKAFMRATVITLEMLVYASVAIKFCSTQKSLFVAMVQPAILLIDHGHFQYNTVTLGLSLWGLFFMNGQRMLHCVIGSIFFCLALCFKQMTLYYAPAVGCYLLGRCFGSKVPLRRFVALALTVIAVFALLWWPFVVSGPEDFTPLDRLLQVVRRIFPVQRGLFEGKVANIWCALSVRPFRVRERLGEWQLLAAFALTVLMIIPAALASFQLGFQQAKANDSCGQRSIEKLLTASASSSLAFFLASFQVHEKSLLLALAPTVFVHDLFGDRWFAIVATWTLWPLLVVDRLRTAYVCVMCCYLCILTLYGKSDEDRIWERFPCLSWIPKASYAVMVILHVAELFLTPPSSLPDLFPVLWSVVGCGLVAVAYVLTVVELFWKVKVD